MVWAAVIYNQQVSPSFASGRQTSQHNTKTLEENLLPFAEFNDSLWEFQQDNASILAVNIPKTFFLILITLKFSTSQHVTHI